MNAGYLAVETHSAHPGVVRLVVNRRRPDPGTGARVQPRIRYIAHFNDCEAAAMHAHELLKRRLLDTDSRLYRVPLEQAIAALESLDLHRRRVYLDTGFSSATKAAIAQLAVRLGRRRRRRDALFQAFGYLGIAILLLNLLIL